MNRCHMIDLGLIGYAEAWALQKRIVAARKTAAIEDVLLVCEHPHVITQGRNGKREHLLVSKHVLRQKGVEYYETSRGGDITYHGPGQIVGYPILNLGAIRRDVVWYVRMLEEAMIRATSEFGITAERVAGKTGIWVKSGDTEEKLAAIGVHISRWVTSHGFAYNVSTALRYFDLEHGMKKELTRQQYLDLYYYMRLNRAVEDTMVKLFRQNKIVGGLYSSLGQEAISVGTSYALEKKDWLAPMIRNIGALLVKGVPPRDIFMQH